MTATLIGCGRLGFSEQVSADAQGAPDTSEVVGLDAPGYRASVVGDASTWNVNHGSAAGFTLEGDGLVAAPTSPSD